jgi:hypothetical protein
VIAVDAVLSPREPERHDHEGNQRPLGSQEKAERDIQQRNADSVERNHEQGDYHCKADPQSEHGEHQILRPVQVRLSVQVGHLVASPAIIFFHRTRRIGSAADAAAGRPDSGYGRLETQTLLI